MEKLLKGTQEAADRMASLRDARGGKTPVRLDPIQKAAADPKSKTKAIAGKCYDCEGRDSDPHWRWRVGNCGVKGCALWPVRPYRRMEGKPVPPSLAT